MNIINLRERGNRGLTGQHRTHDIRSNGTWELPFGPGRPLFRNAPGWLSRIVERWQFGGIFSVSSGAPMTLTTGINNHHGLTQNFPDLAMSLPKSFGEVKKSGLGPGVITYFDGLERVEDPIRATITPPGRKQQLRYCGRSGPDGICESGAGEYRQPGRSLS
jgi:hypothetical protein